MSNKLNQMMQGYKNHMGLPQEQSDYVNDGESYNPNGNVVDDFTSVGSRQVVP